MLFSCCGKLLNMTRRDDRLRSSRMYYPSKRKPPTACTFLMTGLHNLKRDNGSTQTVRRMQTSKSRTHSTPSFVSFPRYLRRHSDGRYVRVLGTLKIFGQKRYITATHIIEIPPERVCDELCFHIAEAAMMSIIFERGPVCRPYSPHAIAYTAAAASSK